MDVLTLVDLVLVFLGVEVVALAWLRDRRSGGPSLVALLSNLGAGLCLVLAVRNALQNPSALVLGGLLALAGACHAIDLVGRLKR